MKKTNNPHDALMKFTLSHKRESVKLIRDYLPKEFVEKLDLSTLKPMKDSFVNESLSEFFSDMVFSCKMADTLIYINILVEHKSFLPKFPSLQIIRYLIEGYELQAKNAGKSRELVAIVPIIIYHGKPKWPTGLFKEKHFKKVPFLWEHIPEVKYFLIDLSKFSNKEILKTNEFLETTLFVLKHYRNFNRIINVIDKILIFDRTKYARENVLKYLNALGMYLEQTNNKTIVKEKIDMEAKKRLYYGDPGFVSIYDQRMMKAEKEGLEKGLQKGMQKGMEKGIQKGLIKGLAKGKAEGLELGLLHAISVFKEKIPEKTNKEIAEFFEVDLELINRHFK